MNLYIRKLIIEKDSVLSEHLHFNKKLTVIEESSDTLEILKLILKGEGNTSKAPYTLSFFAQVKIENIYYIRGTKNQNQLHWQVTVKSENGDEDCFDEFHELISASNEIDSISFFKNFRWQNYSHRLRQYLKLIYYNDNSEFARRTNSFSSTRTFRAFISGYIKNFKPIKLSESKDYYLRLKESGIFAVCKGESEEKVTLSESEKMLSHYLCYLSLADFWERAERIRNLNMVTKPLVVSDFIERLDESINTREILRRTSRLSRQTIIFTKGNRLPH